MKKELKFRAWHKVKGKMIKVYGFDEKYIYEYSYDSPDYCENIFPSEDCELMQFTGLTDKNGKEIYEGDLLMDRAPIDGLNPSFGSLESHFPVVWDNENLMWCVDSSFKKDGGHLTSLIEYFGNELEVSGNIFENPELLKS